jgi:hypothetical protein
VAVAVLASILVQKLVAAVVAVEVLHPVLYLEQLGLPIKVLEVGMAITVQHPTNAQAVVAVVAVKLDNLLLLMVAALVTAAKVEMENPAQ